MFKITLHPLPGPPVSPGVFSPGPPPIPHSQAWLGLRSLCSGHPALKAAGATAWGLVQSKTLHRNGAGAGSVCNRADGCSTGSRSRSGSWTRMDAWTDHSSLLSCSHPKRVSCHQRPYGLRPWVGMKTLGFPGSPNLCGKGSPSPPGRVQGGGPCSYGSAVSWSGGQGAVRGPSVGMWSIPCPLGRSQNTCLGCWACPRSFRSPPCNSGGLLGGAMSWTFWSQSKGTQEPETGGDGAGGRGKGQEAQQSPRDRRGGEQT